MAMRPTVRSSLPGDGEARARWLAIGATLLAFWAHRPLAGLLMVPYLLWVSFAALLNFQIWRLNG